MTQSFAKETIRKATYCPDLNALYAQSGNVMLQPTAPYTHYGLQVCEFKARSTGPHALQHAGSLVPLTRLFAAHHSPCLHVLGFIHFVIYLLTRSFTCSQTRIRQRIECINCQRSNVQLSIYARISVSISCCFCPHAMWAF